ncbi:Uncharacterized protein APZ42_034162 [Daphnia magna]|uniref:Uncharacterized protein n=1 Tax=Daphnia magna TaxID=35525 RepID=A0A164KDT6_9CRUS|nr:Uncharacterized protein APZ42_034162 [Daphnia magna]
MYLFLLSKDFSTQVYETLNQSNELLPSLSIVSFLTDEVSSCSSQTSHQMACFFYLSSS